jgi:hypothetical protein
VEPIPTKETVALCSFNPPSTFQLHPMFHSIKYLFTAWLICAGDLNPAKSARWPSGTKSSSLSTLWISIWPLNGSGRLLEDDDVPASTDGEGDARTIWRLSPELLVPPTAGGSSTTDWYSSWPYAGPMLRAGTALVRLVVLSDSSVEVGIRGEVGGEESNLPSNSRGHELRTPSMRAPGFGLLAYFDEDSSSKRRIQSATSSKRKE